MNKPHPLDAGFFNWAGVPVRLTYRGGTPEYFDGSEWHDVPDDEYGKCMHDKVRVTEAEMNAHVELRKQQHAEFLERRRQAG